MIANPKIPPREVYPQSHWIWLEEKEDGSSRLEKRLGYWLEDLGTAEELFQKHVYENPDMGEGDLRQHRLRIYALMAEGETIALELLRLATPAETKNHIALVDQKLRGLWDVLHAWHGDLNHQADVPESFKQSARELEEGKIVDMDVG